MPDVLAKWLVDSRRGLVGWTIGLAAVGVTYAAFWPTVDSPAMRQALESYPKAMLEAMSWTDLATAAGYLTSTVYGLLSPLLVMIFAITSGARIIAGDEETGTLDLLLAHPVSRTRFALGRYGALVAALVLMNVALWLAMLAMVGPARLEGIGALRFAAMGVHLLVFGMLFAALVFALGAVTGRRGLTIGIGSGLAVLSYLANGVLPQVEALEWTKAWSPFDWYLGSTPLRNGLAAGDLLLMLGAALAFVVVGLWGFNRRDLAT